ncbi:NACHT domain-containing protein [Cellulosimicrobium cellulans]|uniref:NACHT domain-containing protein n=1 Tax=Cellulosimicrobium cellulans TaxID=1710 RepID=UPI0035DEAAA2
MEALAIAIFQIVGEAILALSVGGIKSRKKRKSGATGASTVSWSNVILSSSSMQGPQLAVLANVPDEETAAALASFLKAPEGKAVARCVAIAQVSDAREGDMEALTKNAVALLKLYSRTQDLGEEYAHDLVVILRRVVDRNFAKVRREDPEAASRMHDLALSERQSQLFRGIALTTAELWDLGSTPPESLRLQIRHYCEALASDYNNLPLPSLSTERRVPIESVYVEPEVTTNGSNRRPPGTPVLIAILAAHSRAVVLGNPGGGKSTLVRATVFHLANNRLRSDAAPIPFVVRLGQYAKMRTHNGPIGIAAFICKDLSASEFATIDESALRYLLATGQAVVFFDGLDEILELSERRSVRDAIEHFATRYRLSQMVVTSREVGYEEAPLENGFARAVISPMNDTHVHEYARRFFRTSLAMTDAESQALTAAFSRESVIVSDLRRNPLMLGLLCLLYETGRSIPRNLADLYSACADLLFSQWDARRGIRVDIVDEGTAKDAVQSVALEVFRNGEEVFPESWLSEELIDFFRREQVDNSRLANDFAESVIQLWRGRRWLLVRDQVKAGEDHYRFSHRTFMEYFAACGLAYNSDAAGLWDELEPLILERSATVFSLLAAQIHSKLHRGNGGSLIGSLRRAAAVKDSRTAWNVGYFAADVAPLLRADNRSKRELYELLVSVVIDLEALVDAYPSPSYAYIDVFGDRAVGGQMSLVDTEWDDYEDDADRHGVYSEKNRRAMTFARATLPVFALARNAGETAGHVGGELGLALQTSLTRARDVRQLAARLKFIAELQAMPYLPEWEGLSKGQLESWSSWGREIWGSEEVRAVAAQTFGLDFWLDVYLARSGYVSLDEFVVRRGAPGLFLGGWGLPVAGAPVLGTPLHRVYLEIVRSLAFDNGFSVTMLEHLYDALLRVMRGGALAQSVQDLFERVEGLAVGEFPAEMLAVLSDKQRAGLVLLLASLTVTGHEETLLALAGSEEPLIVALRSVSGVVIYSGEFVEAERALPVLIEDGDIRAEVAAALGVLVSP